MPTSRPRIRWASLLTVLLCVLVALVCVGAALRGRRWALVVALVAALVAVREVRALQRRAPR
jgi:4-hydroxybenzoate polyprenyltransferase